MEEITTIFDEISMLRSNKQSRFPQVDVEYKTYITILYKDSTIYDYDEVINTIKGYTKYYAFIEHEPEKNETKTHTHVILHFSSGVKVDRLSRQLNVPIHYFEIPLSFRGVCRYFTHIDYPEKLQYHIQDIELSRSFFAKFMKCYDDEKTDEEILNDILEFIRGYDSNDEVELEIAATQFVSRCFYSRIWKTYYISICKFISSECKNRNKYLQ